MYELGDYQGCFEAICRATNLCSQTDVTFLLRLSTRLAKCLVQGVRNGAVSGEAITGDFEVIDKLKGLASSESTGVTDELQSAWKQWDLVQEEATGDATERKRSAQLSLAGMDFKRQKLYVPSVRLPHAQRLSGTRREPSLEYFHVCSGLLRTVFTFLTVHR